MSSLDGLRGAAQAGLTFDCSGVPTFARAIGRGPPLIVVHGGPGLSHDYLVRPLATLTDRRTLIFYDQPGCGRSGGRIADLTLERTARHFLDFAGMIDPNASAGVVAHSWGTLVLAAALAEQGPVPTEGLLISPAAVTRQSWDEASGKLLRTIPEPVLNAFLNELASAEAHISMAPLLPYYTAGSVEGRAEDLSLRCPTYTSVMGSLGDFDFSAAIARGFGQLDVLLSQHDFTSPDLLRDVVATARRLHFVNAGHFAFWEQPRQFDAVLRDVFRSDPG